MSEKLAQLKKKGSSGETELHCQYWFDSTYTATVSCKDGYAIVIRTATPTLTVNGIAQTAIGTGGSGNASYSWFHLGELNNATLVYNARLIVVWID